MDKQQSLSDLMAELINGPSIEKTLIRSKEFEPMPEGARGPFEMALAELAKLNFENTEMLFVTALMKNEADPRPAVSNCPVCGGDHPAGHGVTQIVISIGAKEIIELALNLAVRTCSQHS